MTDAEFYLDSRAGIVKYWITAARAREIYETQKGSKHFSGDLSCGFEYWVPGPGGIEQLVYVSVMPLPTLLVPQSARDELAAGARSVPVP